MAVFRRMPAVREVVCLVLLVAWSSGVAASIGRMAPSRAPVWDGSSHAFWYLATDVELSDGIAGAFGGDSYFVSDEWAGYGWNHLHGSDIYRVPVANVEADLDDVVGRLEQAHRRGVSNAIVRGYAQWRDDNEPDKDKSAKTLLARINEERRRELAAKDADLLAYSLADEMSFAQRWQRADWFWATAVFEWTFLSCLPAFVLWPVIRGATVLRCATHVAAVPLLFWLPTYLGYSTYSFTSAGPSGGIVYPYLLRFRPGAFTTPYEAVLLQRLPPILEVLSTPIGTPAAISGMGMPGPTYAVIVGLVLAAVLVAAVFGFTKLHAQSARKL